MIKVHHARRARSARVIWLLEELGVPYEVNSVAFTPEVLKSPAFLALHPLGQVPVIEDGDIKLFESGAIVEYLLERYGEGRLAPAVQQRARAEYLQWFHFGEAGIARYVGDVVRNRFILPEPERSAEVAASARTRLHASFAVVERALQGRDFICGSEFTAADIMISYGVVMARIVGELPAELRNLAGYLERLKARPAYAKAWA